MVSPAPSGAVRCCRRGWTRVTVVRQQRAEKTRCALLAAAAAEFAQHGYTGATLMRISKRAGVILGALTFHFPAKEQLAEAVTEAGASATRAAPQQPDHWLDTGTRGSRRADQCARPTARGGPQRTGGNQAGSGTAQFRHRLARCLDSCPAPCAGTGPRGQSHSVPPVGRGTAGGPSAGRRRSRGPMRPPRPCRPGRSLSAVGSSLRRHTGHAGRPHPEPAPRRYHQRRSVQRRPFLPNCPVLYACRSDIWVRGLPSTWRSRSRTRFRIA
ncbi:TetR family transcriptional regulator [Streptomyces sp. NPDC058572]|uniref:TetR family transcriptional regulator n=1 Tax=Streptomyces sp. NPDC058572 TaxID=3346546 RepID=UPI0036478622